jgi:pilus assembly protein CpaE
METTAQSKTILLVSINPSVIESTRTSLVKDNILKLIEREITSENLFPVIAETKPDVILLDFEFQQHPYDLVEKIVSKFSKCVVVAILPESEKDDSVRVLQSGARDLVQYPYQSDNLVISIKRAIEHFERNQSSSLNPTLDEDAKPANTFVIFSPKGGVGTTTISTNLAISLHRTLKEDVLLIDGKHLFGHIALFYNIRTGNSITDLIAHAGNLDEQLIKQVAVRHTSGVYVLPSPNSFSEAQGIKPENLFKVIQSLKKVFPNIIIDGGNYLNENTVTYMDTSDKILLVLNPDIASMRDVKQFIKISDTLAYPRDKILLILNLTGRKADVKREEIENILKMKIFGKIPADGNLALSSLNEGVPILLKKPNHPISKAFNEITKELEKIVQTSKTE